MSSGKKGWASYPEDEFDRLAEEGSRGENAPPQGVHRRPTSFFRAALPYLLVLVLAPAIAYAAILFYIRLPDSTDEAAEPTTSAAAESTTSAPTTPTATPTPTAAATVDHAASVKVFNGAGIGGIAGQAKETLEAAGWRTVTADDYGNETEPTVTTVFYASDAQAVSAKQVAADLGIDTVQLDPNRTSAITVVLRADFQP